MPKPFYINSAIPYVNAAPHIGHILEYVQTDAVARYQRLVGKDVYYLFGSDENSLKNVQAAEKAGVPVSKFVAEHAKDFFNLKEALNLTFDYFFRTTEKRHFVGAQKLWSACDKKDIYKKKYSGLYCVGCEVFYTPDELVDGLCPEHKTKPETVEEENYFFRLSRYQKQIYRLIATDKVRLVPTERKNEMLAFLDRGLEDFSISRSKERAHGWGVPVPGDESQIMYVWFDALAYYITALDYSGDQKLYKKYWVQGPRKREAVHVIGKGIARFHAIYWLGMLLSAKLPLPTQEFIHGYITVNGEKISKSLGNVIDPYAVIQKYGTDGVRYYLLGALSPYQDGDFSYEKFEQYYTAHLSNGVGNLTSRILTMLEKYSGGKILGAERRSRGVAGLAKAPPDRFDTKAFWEKYEEHFAQYRFDEMILAIQRLVAVCDDVITTEKPWAQVKEGKNIQPLLYQLAEVLRHIALGLLPVMPIAAEEILSRLGLDLSTVRELKVEQRWGKLKKGGIINKGENLFPRLINKA